VQYCDKSEEKVSAMDRLSSEQAFHDDQARQRSATFAHQPDRLRFHDASYLDHETWVRPAFERLGDVRGRDVLDYGCGHGMAAVVLARHGARVTAFDLAHAYLAEARARAEANGVAVAFVQANGERLPFAAGSFDAVWGHAILHHLALATAGRELFRVLRPGSVAVFCEPWGGNPLLSWARRRLPYPGKERTPDEQPLRRCDVRVLRTVFPVVEVRGYQLLSMARRVLRPGRVTAALGHCDDWLLPRLPALQGWCRYAVLTLRKGL
jgi:ubiquinone/menaquinone biosynthesis C-methylase UbiE